MEKKILGYSAIVRGLQMLAERECIPSIHVTAGDHTLPGPFYQAAAEIEEFGQPGLADIAMYNAMGLNASGMGNHEFDGGINEFAHMLATANYPFISVNLDFSKVELATGTPAIRIGRDASNCRFNKGKVVKSCWLRVGASRIGLIGRAPADFFNIIQDPDTRLPGLDFFGGRDPGTNQPLVSAVGQVLEQVAKLERLGIKRIILLDHAQDFTGDPLKAKELRGIDIIASAGSTGFFANTTANGPFNFLRPEDRDRDPNDPTYPVYQTDKEGKPVLVINTEQLYRYVGHLIVTFDEDGVISEVDTDRSGPIATSQEAIDLLGEVVGENLSAHPRVADVFEQLQATPTIQDAFTVVGTTNYELNGLRADVRSRETNLGRLAADSTIWFAQGNGFPGTDIALKNGGGIRDTIKGPNIIRLTIQAALAFNNTLTVLEMTGDQILAAMENSVSRADYTDGRFPQLAGVQMEFDTSFPAIEGQASVSVPSRVRNLTITKHDGSVVTLVTNGTADATALADIFVLATNSFTATGGDGYAALAAANVLGATTTGEQQILEDYIINALGGTVDLQDPPAAPRVVRLP